MAGAWRGSFATHGVRAGGDRARRKTVEFVVREPDQNRISKVGLRLVRT